VELGQATNDAGRYEFSGLRAGTYTVTISNLPTWASFSTTSHQVTVAASQSVNIDFSGTVLPVPSLATSYIEACPAVILPLDYEDSSNITVGARDAASDPIAGAEVILSGDGYFEATDLTTGANGNASTFFYSPTLGAKTFTAQITANGTMITLQESDDLYVDQYRGALLQKVAGDDGQTVVAGESATFRVDASYAGAGPAAFIPIGWELQGGNCFYGFTDGAGRASANVSVPASTTPGKYELSALAAGSTPVVFVFYVVPSLAAPPQSGSPGSRMVGSPAISGEPLSPGAAHDLGASDPIGEDELDLVGGWQEADLSPPGNGKHLTGGGISNHDHRIR
jgi:hypothetical protein